MVSATTSPFSTGSARRQRQLDDLAQVRLQVEQRTLATTVQLRSFFAPLGRSTVIAALVVPP